MDTNLVLGAGLFALGLVLITILLINQIKRRRTVHPIQEPESKWFSLLLIITKTSNTGVVSEQGYGLFSYQREDLHEALKPLRALVGSSKDDNIVKPLMNIIVYTTTMQTYQFFSKDNRPDIEADDIIPICLAHNRVLVSVGFVISPCADSIGMRKNIGIITSGLAADPSMRRKSVPLAQNDSFFPLRQKIIIDQRWDLLE